MFFEHKHVVTINDIKKNFYNGALYNSKYRLIITPPLYVNTNNITEKLVVLSKTAKMPEHKIGAEEIKIKGRPVTIKKQLELGNSYDVNVYEESSMKVRKILDRWIDMGDRLGYGGQRGYDNGNIKIYQLDGDNNEVYGVEFYDVFLTSISDISYDGTSAGEVISYNLSFSYSGWDVINI